MSGERESSTFTPETLRRVAEFMAARQAEIRRQVEVLRAKGEVEDNG